MKRKSIISVILLCMGLGICTSSCEDMLTPDSERHSYEVAQDTLYSYWGIVKSLQNLAERNVVLNECRGDLVSEVEGNDHSGDSIRAILSFGEENPALWEDGSSVYLQVKDYYHVINSCNAYISMCDTARTTGTNMKYMAKELAQVKAIRAWVYMQLCYAYGKVPFVDKPMLSTQQIKDYWTAPVWVEGKDLAGKFAEDLTEMLKIEKDKTNYGFPSYRDYGYLNYVCHSERVMFPIDIVLGDLYLLANEYEKAAKSYYDFLNDDQAGPILINDANRCQVKTSRTQDAPLYTLMGNYYDTPWRDNGGFSKSSEAITAIPSTKGKLDGKVLTEVNRLFGWTPQMSASNVTITSTDEEEEDESGTYSYISLYENYEKELGASQGFIALCDSQKYELYLGETLSDRTELTGIRELTFEGKPVGDARRAWIMCQTSQRNGLVPGLPYADALSEGETRTSTFISKQNPNGLFSTTGLLVYRKATVWLRFAEAINRMGYPSIAFAILRDGLCNNTDWFPEEEEYYPKTVEYGVQYTAEDGSEVYFPEDWKGVKASFAEYEEKEALFLSALDILKDTDSAMYVKVDSAYKSKFEYPLVVRCNERENYFVTFHDLDSTIIGYVKNPCYYASKDEVKGFKANFDLSSEYMKASGKRNPFYKMSTRWEEDNISSNMSFPENDGSVAATGIHARGCGMLIPGDVMSSYNYVNMVSKKAANYGKTLTKKDIYNPENLETVQNCVEDLIADEMGLELAFEGTRFADLYRMAMHRTGSQNQVDFLANRVATRYKDAAKNAKLKARLQDKANWFLKLPNE